MTGDTSGRDPAKCEHYAPMFHKLQRPQFDGAYWSIFLINIFALFLVASVFQRTMLYRHNPECTDKKFRKRLKSALVSTIIIFLIGATLLVLETYLLLALQFCDGEDIISFYWATWTMLQLGSVIAILGVVLNLFLHIHNLEHPMWATALGTPVLVVAGIFHVLLGAVVWNLKQINDRVRSKTQLVLEKTPQSGTTSSATSIKLEAVQLEQGLKDGSLAELGQQVYFVLDCGDDDRVKRWPAYAGETDGKAILHMTGYNIPLPADTASRPEASASA